jgi:Transposase IS66 family
MLEGDAKSQWYLWGFSSEYCCFLECHSTRSGDVSTAVLSQSVCEVLVSDVYSGYSKAIRLANIDRAKENRALILAAYCNAHARRKFKDRDSGEVSSDAESMVEQYKLIYKLNKDSKDLLPEKILEKRAEMKPIFEAMKKEAEERIQSYSKHNQMFIAYNYFLENYEGLTRFLTNHLIPIDNNQSERLLRSHVVGRKTWSSRSGRLPSPISHRTERDSLPSFGSCRFMCSISNARTIGDNPPSAWSIKNEPFRDIALAS